MAVIRSSDLDFDVIKENLKTFLQQQDEFADYDFEASGLSNILDVLAYNTHLNGLIANLAINESFLSTAQLRSSVLSHAETLGYYSRSRTGSSATVNLSVSTALSSPTFISLPANTTFTTEIDNVSYSFQTLEEYIGYNNGSGLFTFETTGGSTSIEITEGTLKTKTFLVGDTTDDQVYVIPDETIDTSTMVVNVYDTATSSSFETYIDVNRAVRIDNDSTIYIIREAPNGYYEVTFSNGNVLGKAPVAGNKIVITYLSTAGAAANGADTFLADESVTISGTDYTLTTTVVSESSGGDAKESIASIKGNAPLSFASQQRMVTAEDYKALILENYSSYLEDVIAWGGNDNVPPVYGRVYVSLKFKDNISASVQQTIKDQIVINLSDNLAIMSIDTVFTDPTNTFMEIETIFNLDPDQTGLSPKAVENDVQDTVESYFTANLNSFGKTFRRSNLLAEIDGLAPAILNSRMNIKLQQRITPSLTTVSDYTLSYPTAIAAADDVNYIVTSSRFTYNDQSCFIRNQLSSTKLQIVNLAGVVQLDNVGSFNATNGTVSLAGFLPTAYEGTAIKVSVTPANQSTIRPLRNYILALDPALSFAQSVIDYQNTAVSLTT